MGERDSNNGLVRGCGSNAGLRDEGALPCVAAGVVGGVGHGDSGAAGASPEAALCGSGGDFGARTYTVLCLDGRMMTTREEAHSHLAARLGLPSYYGRNLDALYDCLTELSGVRIELENVDALAELGGYAGLLLNTLEEAAENNRSIEFVLV